MPPRRHFLRPVAALFLLTWLLTALSPAADVAYPETLTLIAAGSCHRTGPNSESTFATLAATKPDLFLFIGDNIYGDTRDMKVLADKYAALAAVPSWQKFRASTRILATWDDHDYGENDGGAEFPMKRESAAIFRDFFGFPADHPCRSREGIYHSAVFGPAGKRVQVVLLDARTFRSPLRQERIDGKKTYLPDADPAKTMLGAAQWAWLASQLAEPAEVRILASGTQILPEEHRFEKWANLPTERTRLLDLVAKSTGKSLLLTGDRHMAEISATIHDGKSIVELTTSGLTHAGGGRGPGGDEPNRHRVGKLSSAINSGQIAIQWKDAAPTLEVHILDAQAKPVATHTW